MSKDKETRNSSSPAAGPRKRSSGLLGFLRRGPLKQESEVLLEENALWSAHQHAVDSIDEVGRTVVGLRTTVARTRGLLDGTVDRGRALQRRVDELTKLIERWVDGAEQLDLLALNATLEANRLGEKAGRALLLVSTEVKARARAGIEHGGEAKALLDELTHDAEQLGDTSDQARAALAELTDDVSAIESSSVRTERALVEMREALKKTTGTDPETVRTIAEATEHARALVGALGTLTGRVPERLVIAAVRPVLEPIVRLLVDEDEAG